MNTLSKSSALPEIPALFEFTPDSKTEVIDGIRMVLNALIKYKKMNEGDTYTDLLQRPDRLREFVRQFRANRDAFKSMVTDANGTPVMQDNVPLKCGITLAQIERMLVYTCAKKMVGPDRAKSVRFTDILRDSVSFEWQLPLLDMYANGLSEDHFRLLGPNLLMVRTLDGMKTIANMAASDLRKAKTMLGKRFPLILQARPRALTGIVLCKQPQFNHLSNVCGGRVVDFMAGDKEIIRAVLALDEAKIDALGASIPDVSIAVLNVLLKVHINVLKLFLEGFRDVFGEDGSRILSDDDFIEPFLEGATESFDGMDAPAKLPAVQEAAIYKWQALQPRIEQWLAFQDKKRYSEKVADTKAESKEAQDDVDKMFG